MDIREMIDHTILKPEAKEADIEKLCREAAEYGLKAVCINPCYIELASKILKGTSVEIATVVGFPLGANTTECKVFETEDAIIKGATEIDMVVNIGQVKSGNFEYVRNDIAEVVIAANGKTVKVILETCLMNRDEIIKLCKLSKECGAAFVKTSTGFSTGGATVEDVKLMKETVGNSMEVKASGGIRDLDKAKAMIEAGATRLGTSSGLELIES